jgi:antitoxin (DNA-binding transcriptional repressor) of toxin-antitoxin stability system
MEAALRVERVSDRMVANPISADFALVNPIAAPEMAGSFLALDGAGAKVLNGHLTAQEKASLRGSSGRGGGSWRVAGAYEAEEDRGEEEEGTHDEPVARLVPASATGETASRRRRRTRRDGAAAAASACQTAARNRHRTSDGDGAAAAAAARATSETSSSRRASAIFLIWNKYTAVTISIIIMHDKKRTLFLFLFLSLSGDDAAGKGTVKYR